MWCLCTCEIFIISLPEDEGLRGTCCYRIPKVCDLWRPKIHYHVWHLVKVMEFFKHIWTMNKQNKQNKQKTVKSPFSKKLKRDQLPVRIHRICRKRKISDMHYIFMLKHSNATNVSGNKIQSHKYLGDSSERLCTRTHGAWEGSMKYCLFPCLQTNQPQANAGMWKAHLRDCGLSCWILGLL